MRRNEDDEPEYRELAAQDRANKRRMAARWQEFYETGQFPEEETPTEETNDESES